MKKIFFSMFDLALINLTLELLNGHVFACFLVVLLVMLCNLSSGKNSSSPGPLLLLHQYRLKPQRTLTNVGLLDVCPVSIRAQTSPSSVL
jgi:hypothetical protein